MSKKIFESGSFGLCFDIHHPSLYPEDSQLVNLIFATYED